jgi:hypothetical protein
MMITTPIIAGTEIAGHGEDGTATIIIIHGVVTVLVIADHGDITTPGIITTTTGIIIITTISIIMIFTVMVVMVATVVIMDPMFIAHLHGEEDIIIIQ